jgi:cation transport ATPase
MITTYTISGLHCDACIAKTTAALAPFARAVRVTLNPPEARLDDANTADIAVLNAALAHAGAYQLPGPTPATRSTPPSMPVDEENPAWVATYWPLLVIAAYIAIASMAGAVSSGQIQWQAWMTNFMAGFFLVFSAFKFLDLRGFADAYASYDWLAMRWHGYGFIYPFLELALGLAYLFRFEPTVTHIATIALMGYSSLGVISALSKKQRIPCACLGTVLKLPMSTITLVEDLGMVAMAAVGLWAGVHV